MCTTNKERIDDDPNVCGRQHWIAKIDSALADLAL